ncbi:androgen-induced gene 1 protein-like isoform X2 [Daktulosphaira vitifoliae]|uniref:androgen-induced gene 1 protein-like isoform X2 n=1 Tax=Daktulosphaira vitifoliae TaxID=58002 RepID=UPI0021A99540|nr:androgen-induced gene 1 protein-like isoform X2 [Daktulosphaira vitifoliae]
MEVSSIKSPTPVVTSVFCRSFTETERQHLYKVSRLFVTFYYLYVSYYGLFVLDLENIVHPKFGKLGSNWWWKCMSVWSLVIQIAYFFYCTICIDYAEYIFGKSRIIMHLEKNKKVRDFYFVSFVFPVTIYVCLFFWTICAVNKPLLFPKEMSQWIPDWYNHAVHTNPIVLSLLEMITTKRKVPKFSKSLISLCSLGGSYILWIKNCCNYKKNFWVAIFHITDIVDLVDIQSQSS